MIRVVVAAAFAAVVSGCMTFAEDTRKSRPLLQEDGGSQDPNGSQDPDGSTLPADASAVSCSMSVAPGSSVGSCGGPGGGDYAGPANDGKPNDATGKALAADVPVCGSVAGTGADRFTLDVTAGDCFWISFQAASGGVHVNGGGVEKTSGAGDLAFEASSNGPVVVEVSGAPSYKLMFRK